LIRDKRELLANRRNQGNIDNADPARNVSEPVGSSNQPGAHINVPGFDNGITSLTAIEPLLAAHALWPVSLLSITVVSVAL
jgi:hypothetical protein